MRELRAKYVVIRHASARGVAERWHSCYYKEGRGWIRTVTGDRGAVYGALCALGPNPDIDKVAEVTGHKSWSHLSCDGCRDYVECGVSIGEDDAQLYCATCIEEASIILGIRGSAASNDPKGPT